MREADDVPLDKLVEMMMTIGGSTGLTRYSTFDRERYFRSGNLKIGIPIIDRVTGGVAKGEFMIVAGRLGTGKSTTVQWIMKRWWEDNKKILLISKEMLPVDVFSRIDGMVGRFNPLRIRTDHKEDVMPMLRVVTGIVSSRKGEIYVPSQQVASPAQIGALAQNLEIDAIVIDGLYLLRPDGAYSQKWEKVAAISNAVKQMALDLQLPIIGTTQIKRVGAKDEFDPEDLAYSDALGQDADFVVALSPSKAVKSRIEAQLIKTRYGPNVASVLYIDWDSMNIVDESTEGAFESRSEGF
jgi:replicative DNA helicase